MSLLLIASFDVSHASGRKPGSKPAAPRPSFQEEQELPVEDDAAFQAELDRLLASDDGASLADRPVKAADPARAELERLLASDESRNFWEDTKKLFEAIPQAAEVEVSSPQDYYAYSVPGPAPKPRASVSRRLKGWPAVDPSTLPPGAQVQKVWIWQESADCLWNIAKEYYGDPFLWPKIYEANRHLIKDPNVIFPRQQLIIPPLEVSDAGRGARRER